MEPLPVPQFRIPYVRISRQLFRNPKPYVKQSTERRESKSDYLLYSAEYLYTWVWLVPSELVEIRNKTIFCQKECLPLEHLPWDRGVMGSNPARGIWFFQHLFCLSCKGISEFTSLMMNINFIVLVHHRIAILGHSPREFPRLGSATPSKVTKLWRDCTNETVVDASNSSCHEWFCRLVNALPVAFESSSVFILGFVFWALWLILYLPLNWVTILSHCLLSLIWEKKTDYIVLRHSLENRCTTIWLVVNHFYKGGTTVSIPPFSFGCSLFLVVCTITSSSAKRSS